jgi:hypothetical protein
MIRNMIRTLFFGAALLVPGVPYAANPSASFSDQSVPSGSDSAIPAEAQAAGFTTLAANFDFSQSSYATQSNWYDCDGSLPNLLWHQGNPGVSLNNPCNVYQVLDGSNTVMDFEWLSSYPNLYPGGQFNQVGGQTYNNFNATQGLSFPNMYIETVARVARTFDQPANSGGPNAVWTWDVGYTSGHTLEMDVFELYEDQGAFGDGGDSYSHWFSYKTNNLPRGWSPTTYHKYGALLTSDGATSRNTCYFVDDFLQGCGALPANNFTARNVIIASAGSNYATASENIDLYVQYIRVFSCSSWQGSPGDAAHMCNGSRLYNSNGLTYWH